MRIACIALILFVCVFECFTAKNLLRQQGTLQVRNQDDIDFENVMKCPLGARGSCSPRSVEVSRGKICYKVNKRSGNCARDKQTIAYCPQTPIQDKGIFGKCEAKDISEKFAAKLKSNPSLEPVCMLVGTRPSSKSESEAIESNDISTLELGFQSKTDAKRFKNAIVEATPCCTIIESVAISFENILDVVYTWTERDRLNSYTVNDDEKATLKKDIDNKLLFSVHALDRCRASTRPEDQTLLNTLIEDIAFLANVREYAMHRMASTEIEALGEADMNFYIFFVKFEMSRLEVELTRWIELNGITDPEMSSSSRVPEAAQRMKRLSSLQWIVSQLKGKSPEADALVSAFESIRIKLHAYATFRKDVIDAKSLMHRFDGNIEDEAQKVLSDLLGSHAKRVSKSIRGSKKGKLIDVTPRASRILGDDLRRASAKFEYDVFTPVVMSGVSFTPAAIALMKKLVYRLVKALQIQKPDVFGTIEKLHSTFVKQDNGAGFFSLTPLSLLLNMRRKWGMSVEDIETLEKKNAPTAEERERLRAYREAKNTLVNDVNVILKQIKCDPRRGSSKPCNLRLLTTMFYAMMRELDLQRLFSIKADDADFASYNAIVDMNLVALQGERSNVFNPRSKKKIKKHFTRQGPGWTWSKYTPWGDFDTIFNANKEIEMMAQSDVAETQMPRCDVQSAATQLDSTLAPPLSSEETQFLAGGGSWKAGTDLWYLNPHATRIGGGSSFVEVGRDIGLPTVSGPSSTTTWMFWLARYLRLNDDELQILIVTLSAWMSSTRDHSAFEVIVSVEADCTDDILGSSCGSSSGHFSQGYSSSRSENGEWWTFWDSALLEEGKTTFTVRSETAPSLNNVLSEETSFFGEGFSASIPEMTVTRATFLNELKSKSGGCLPSDVLRSESHLIQAMAWAYTGDRSEDYASTLPGAKRCILLSEPVDYCPPRNFERMGPDTFETLTGAATFFSKAYALKYSPYRLAVTHSDGNVKLKRGKRHLGELNPSQDLFGRALNAVMDCKTSFKLADTIAKAEPRAKNLREKFMRWTTAETPPDSTEVNALIHALREQSLGRDFVNLVKYSVLTAYTADIHQLLNSGYTIRHASKENTGFSRKLLLSAKEMLENAEGGRTKMSSADADTFIDNYLKPKVNEFTDLVRLLHQGLESIMQDDLMFSPASTFNIRDPFRGVCMSRRLGRMYTPRAELGVSVHLPDIKTLYRGQSSVSALYDYVTMNVPSMFQSFTYDPKVAYSFGKGGGVLVMDIKKSDTTRYLGALSFYPESEYLHVPIVTLIIQDRCFIEFGDEGGRFVEAWNERQDSKNPKIVEKTISDRCRRACEPIRRLSISRTGYCSENDKSSDDYKCPKHYVLKEDSNTIKKGDNPTSNCCVGEEASFRFEALRSTATTRNGDDPSECNLGPPKIRCGPSKPFCVVRIVDDEKQWPGVCMETEDDVNEIEEEDDGVHMHEDPELGIAEAPMNSREISVKLSFIPRTCAHNRGYDNNGRLFQDYICAIKGTMYRENPGEIVCPQNKCTRKKCCRKTPKYCVGNKDPKDDHACPYVKGTDGIWRGAPKSSASSVVVKKSDNKSARDSKCCDADAPTPVQPTCGPPNLRCGVLAPYCVTKPSDDDGLPMWPGTCRADMKTMVDDEFNEFNFNGPIREEEVAHSASALLKPTDTSLLQQCLVISEA